jgi:hypothetical protein
MIILNDLETIVLTPPRTGSFALHTTLCKRPNAFWCMSIDPHGYQNRYGTTIPHEFKSYRQVLVVRNPYTRLLGLFDEYNEFLVRNSKKPITLTEFLDQRQSLWWRYNWTISRWVQGMEVTGMIRVESYAADLKRVLGIKTRMPKATTSRSKWMNDYKSVDYHRLVDLYHELLPDVIYGYDRKSLTPLIASMFNHGS